MGEREGVEDQGSMRNTAKYETPDGPDLIIVCYNKVKILIHLHLFLNIKNSRIL